VTQAGSVVFSIISQNAKARTRRGPSLDSIAPITGVCYRQEALYVGTTRSFYKCQLEPLAIEEVREIKGGIARLDGQSRQSMSIHSEKGKHYFLAPKNEFHLIADRFKRCVFCGGATLVGRVPREGYLKVSTLVGSVKVVRPTFFAEQPLFQPRSAWDQLAPNAIPEDFHRFGMPLVRRIQQAYKNPEWGRDYALAMSNALYQRPRARVWWLLTRGLIDEGCEVIESLDGADWAFVSNVLMSAIAGLEGREVRVLRAVGLLLGARMVDSAIELLLITKNWDLAVQTLLDHERLWDAALVCRAQPVGTERSRFLREVAARLIGSEFGIAMILFAEAGDLETPAAAFADRGELVQSEIIASLGDDV
jgi:hypothetical protein